jgi:hypothetical protein
MADASSVWSVPRIVATVHTTALITSAKTYACSAWEFAAETGQTDRVTVGRKITLTLAVVRNEKLITEAGDRQ